MEVTEADHEVWGALVDHCASVVVQLLFAARVGRYDLLRIVGILATRFTKWSKACDQQLHKLMRYVNSTLNHRQIGYTGDKVADIVPLMFCDADFAGPT